MTYIQVIQFTNVPTAWHSLLLDLEFTKTGDSSPDRTEFESSGAIAIHEADAEREHQRVFVLVDDLNAAAQSLAGAEVHVAHERMDGVGPVLIVNRGAGNEVTVAAASRETSGPVMVQPILYGSDRGEFARIADALGLQPRIASNSGNWVDYIAAGGGSLAFHAAESSGVALGLEYGGDLDALQERLQAAGRVTALVDEAYNRTLRVQTLGGWELWINEPQHDLHGYHRLS